jgi:hypothetical protein
MASWCYNNIEVSGPSKAVDNFLKAVEGNDEVPHLDFNGILPMPAAIRSADDTNRSRSPESIKELIEKYGASEWYDWAKKNWGTESTGICNYPWNLVKSTKTTKTCRIVIETKYSPPAEFLLYASNLFPKLSFSNKFYEEDQEFVGYHKIKNGDYLECDEPDWDDDEGVEMRKKYDIYSD